jgi:hypothetical protein
MVGERGANTVSGPLADLRSWKSAWWTTVHGAVVNETPRGSTRQRSPVPAQDFAGLVLGVPADLPGDLLAGLGVGGAQQPLGVGEARALHWLGVALEALGDLGRARVAWQAALALYTVLDMPEAEELRRLLDEAGVGAG